MTNESMWTSPTADELDALITEHIALIRMALAKERRQGAGDMWSEIFGVLDGVPGEPQAAADELAKRLADRIVAHSLVATQLVMDLARAHGKTASEILDELQALLTD